MHIKNLYVILILLIVVATLLGCASSSAPHNWLPTTYEAQEETFGAWIQVDLLGKQYHEGEFIAVSTDSVYVLTDLGMKIIGRDKIIKAKLTTYDSQHGTLGYWTTLGSVSTISHGFGLILSLPIWLLTGITSTASQSYAPMEKFPNSEWSELSKFARFPAGVPHDIYFLNKIKHKK